MIVSKSSQSKERFYELLIWKIDRYVTHTPTHSSLCHDIYDVSKYWSFQEELGISVSDELWEEGLAFLTSQI